MQNIQIFYIYIEILLIVGFENILISSYNDITILNQMKMIYSVLVQIVRCVLNL